MRILSISLLVLVSLASCNSEEKEEKAPVQTETADAREYEMVPIQHEGFDLFIAIPEDYREGNKLMVEMNEAYGQLEVSSGDVFQVEITEEEADRNQLVEHLENDLVFQHELVEENDQAVLYRQFLKGTDQEFWHFYVHIQSGERQYVIKDSDMGELNKYQSRKIFEALKYAALNNKSNSPS